jgi:peptide/nickel transport system substrate-binding protein
MNLRRWLIGLMLAGGVGFALHEIHAANDAAAEAKTAATAVESSKQTVDRGVTRGGKAPAESDTLILSYQDDPETVNAVTANDTVSEEFMRLVYESMADRKYSNPDVWEPMLAESWTFDEPNLEYTIHLRKGVKWQPITLPSGKELPATEFTARDVKFTFDCILNKNVEAAHTRSYYEDPEATDDAHKYKIKVSLVRGDPYTVKIKWTKPYFNADEFTLGVAIIPRHVFSVDAKGDPISFDFTSKEFAKGFNDHWANRKMCGTGPMIFKEWVRDQRVVLERNPNYWGQPFYFNRLIYRHIKNLNTAVQQMLQNAIDWNVIPEKDLYLQSKSHPSVLEKKVNLVEYRYPGYRYLGYNLKRPFFKDKQVRWAIGHAIPIDEIIANIYHGLAERITGPFLPGSTANDASLPLVDYDLDKSRKLLDEAGWKLAEGDSVRSKMVNGQKVEARFDLIIYSDSASYASIATIIKENCRKIGVNVKISSTNWALMLRKLNEKEFDACILGWAMSWKDDPYQIWHSSQADINESSNHVGYKNPQVDKLIEQLRVTMNADKQTEIYRKIHRLIYDDQPYTFLFIDKYTAGYDARLENVKNYPIRPCIDTREWYSSKPRALGQ